MQHFRAVVGQLGSLAVGDFVEHRGIGHQARRTVRHMLQLLASLVGNLSVT